MTDKQEYRYDSLLNKAMNNSLYPEEEIELRDLSNLRIRKLQAAKEAAEYKNNGPHYEWDLKNRDNGAQEKHLDNEQV